MCVHCVSTVCPLCVHCVSTAGRLCEKLPAALVRAHGANPNRPPCMVCDETNKTCLRHQAGDREVALHPVFAIQNVPAACSGRRRGMGRALKSNFHLVPSCEATIGNQLASCFPNLLHKTEHFNVIRLRMSCSIKLARARTMGEATAAAATVADGGPGDVGRSGCGGGGDGGGSGGCPRHPAEKPCQAVLVR